MADENTILHTEAELVRELQQTIRKEMGRRGRTLKAASYDSGIGYSTLVTYFPEPGSNQKPTALSVAALRRLCGALPADLLSLLLPDGWQIVRAPEAINHDELCEIAEQYTIKKMAAHHPDSEAGREIGPNEDRDLTGVVVQLAARVAA